MFIENIDNSNILFHNFRYVATVGAEIDKRNYWSNIIYYLNR